MKATGEPMAILLVDDEPRLRETLARALTASGYQVDQAGSHREAFTAAMAGEHRLMVVDVNLPDATGWDLPRDLATAGKSPPAVVFSAIPLSTARIREFKPFGVLHKPFPIESLLRSARKAENHE